MNNITRIKKFLIYFVNFCQPIKYVFMRLWLVCFDSTALYELQDNKHSLFIILLFTETCNTALITHSSLLFWILYHILLHEK